MLLLPRAFLERPRRFALPIFDPESKPALALAAALFALVMTGPVSGSISWSHAELDSIFLSLLGIALIGGMLQRLSVPGIGSLFQQISLFLMVGALAALASAALATTALPYADPWLSKADAILLPGFSWTGVMLGLQQFDRSLFVLSHIYASLTWQPFLLLFILALRRNADGAWRFLTAWTVALVVCAALFPLMPAQGAYVYYGLSPSDVPAVRVFAAWQFLPLIEGIRDGSIATLGLGTLGGIITMPSFHAAGAIILAWGFWRTGPPRWIFLILNSAMAISAIPIGGHYIVDGVAGSLVALGSIAIAERWHAGSAAPTQCGVEPITAIC
jgi:membrane-associated phospholipid phosphatase